MAFKCSLETTLSWYPGRTAWNFLISSIPQGPRRKPAVSWSSRANRPLECSSEEQRGFSLGDLYPHFPWPQQQHGHNKVHLCFSFEWNSVSCSNSFANLPHFVFDPFHHETFRRGLRSRSQIHLRWNDRSTAARKQVNFSRGRNGREIGRSSWWEFKIRRTRSWGAISYDQLKRLGIPSVNLECFGCPKAEALFDALVWLETCENHTELNAYHHCAKLEVEAFGHWLTSQVHWWIPYRFSRPH